VFGYKLNV